MGSMSFDRTKFFADLYANSDNSQEQIEFVMETISDLLEGLDWKEFDDGMQQMGGPRLFGRGDEVGDPKFDEINDILRVANPRKLDPAVGLAFITMTFKNQDKYSEYNAYKESLCAFFESIGKKKLAKDVRKRFMPL
jgi:hypothetical protein